MTLRTVEYRLVDELASMGNPVNAKAHDEGGIASSIDRFGFTSPIELDERTSKLVAGHGRIAALADAQARARAGDEQPVPDGIDVDDEGRWLAPLVRGWASANDEEAEAYGVAANQLTIAGGFNQSALLESLERIAPTPLSFDGLGFDSSELDVMLAELRTGDDTMPPDPPTWGRDRPVDTSVAFRFGDYSGKVQRSIYDKFLAEFERLRETNDAVLLDEVLVAWFGLK